MSILGRTQAAQAAYDKDRRGFLRSLTRENALLIYSDLCRAWEENPNKQGLERLEQRRIAQMLELRRKLDRIGGRNRDGHST
jgi:hypothetical protein